MSDNINAILQWIFVLFFGFFCSKFIDGFSFWGYLAIMILQYVIKISVLIQNKSND